MLSYFTKARPVYRSWFVLAITPTLHDSVVLIRSYQTVMKNDELLKRQERLNHAEELLDAFRRKLIVLGRVEAGKEVRQKTGGEHLTNTLFCA